MSGTKRAATLKYKSYQEPLNDGKITALHLHPSDQPPANVEHTVLLVHEKCKILFYGQAKVAIYVRSQVSINGSLVEPEFCSEFDLFSPTSHSPVSIEFLDFHDNRGYLPEFPWEDAAANEFEDRVCETKRPAEYILFQPLQNQVIKSLMRISKFANLFSFENPLPIYQELGFSFRTISDREVGGYQLSEEMKKGIKLALKSKVVLVAGPKNSGKSSYLRAIFNTLLNNYTTNFIDCDIGQPEFTISGLVSVTKINRQCYGPPFAHQLASNDIYTSLSSCFYGSASPSDDPRFYLKCLEYIKNSLAKETSLPLMINTMGWTQNLGFTLLMEQIKMFKPDLIIQLEIENSSHQNLAPLTPDYISQQKDLSGNSLAGFNFKHRTHIIRSMSRLSALSERDQKFSRTHRSFGAPDHRDLMTISTLMTNFDSLPRSLPKPSLCQDEFVEHPVDSLLSVIPYRIKITNGKGEHPLIGLYSYMKPEKENDNFTVDDMLKIFNASLITLMSVNPDTLRISKNNDFLTVDSKPVCECLGFGVVRAVETVKKELMIVTEVDHETLATVNLLGRGHINLPSYYFTEQPEIRLKVFTEDFKLPPHVAWHDPNQTVSVPGNSTISQKRQYPRTKRNDAHDNSGSNVLD